MIKKVSLVAALLLSTSCFALQVDSNATLVTGVRMGYSSDYVLPVYIEGNSGKTYVGEAKNNSPMTERIYIRLTEECSKVACAPIKGYVVGRDDEVGVKAETAISNYAPQYAMSSVISERIARNIGDCNNSVALKKLADLYHKMAEEASPYLEVVGNTPIGLVIE